LTESLFHRNLTADVHRGENVFERHAVPIQATNPGALGGSLDDDVQSTHNRIGIEVDVPCGKKKPVTSHLETV